MGLESGRVSITRYKVMGAPERLTIKSLGERYRRYLAKPLKLHNPKELLFGWERPIDFPEEAGDGYWDMTSCSYEDGFLLRARIERRKVPASLLSHLYKGKLTAQQKEGKPLRREAKQKLRDELKEDLLGKALPEIKFIDAIWDGKKSEVCLLATSKADKEVFEKLFRQSFSDEMGLVVVPIDPPLLGMKTAQYQKPENYREYFQGITQTTPTTFTGQNVGH